MSFCCHQVVTPVAQMGVWPHYYHRSFNVSDGGGRRETKPTASVSDWLSGRKSAYSCFLFDDCRLAGWNTLFNSWEPRAHCQKDTIGITCVVSEKIFFPFSCKVKIKKNLLHFVQRLRRLQSFFHCFSPHPLVTRLQFVNFVVKWIAVSRNVLAAAATAKATINL